MLRVYFEKTYQIFILYNSKNFKSPNMPIQRLRERSIKDLMMK